MTLMSCFVAKRDYLAMYLITHSELRSVLCTLLQSVTSWYTNLCEIFVFKMVDGAVLQILSRSASLGASLDRFRRSGREEYSFV